MCYVFHNVIFVDKTYTFVIIYINVHVQPDLHHFYYFKTVIKRYMIIYTIMYILKIFKQYMYITKLRRWCVHGTKINSLVIPNIIQGYYNY